MTYLYLAAGLVLFFGIHLAISIGPCRRAIGQALGETPKKLLVTVVSFVGLGLIIYGYQQAPFDPVYNPLSEARGLAHAVLPLAFIALAGAHAPSNIKRYLRHPMSLAVLAWAAVHLAANGDLASVLLFGAFALYALLDILVTSRPGPPPPPRPRSNDLIAIVAGIVAYSAAMWAHGALFGVPVIG